jgi:hypothetical protein
VFFEHWEFRIYSGKDFGSELPYTEATQIIHKEHGFVKWHVHYLQRIKYRKKMLHRASLSLQQYRHRIRLSVPIQAEKRKTRSPACGFGEAKSIACRQKTL